MFSAIGNVFKSVGSGVKVTAGTLESVVVLGGVATQTAANFAERASQNQADEMKLFHAKKSTVLADRMAKVQAMAKLQSAELAEELAQVHMDTSVHMDNASLIKQLSPKEYRALWINGKKPSLQQLIKAVHAKADGHTVELEPEVAEVAKPTTINTSFDPSQFQTE